MATWQVPQDFPVLKNDRVHIWHANLNLPPQQIDCLRILLSQDEIVRADKFRFARHQIRFVAARGILRQLLGRYLNISPQDLSFTYGSKGKPDLERARAFPIQFNLSHSQEHALFGFSRQHSIGVDLEYQRPMPDALKIARRFFSPNEFQMLAKSSPETQAQLFFQLWTAKEAYLKAIGTGLADSLASVEIACNLRNSMFISAIGQSSETITNWSLYSCTPATNYAAAIAIRSLGAKINLDYWHWQPNIFDPLG